MIKDLVVTTTGKDGKKFHKNIGQMRVREDGSSYIMITALGQTIFANLYDHKPKEDNPKDNNDIPF